MGSLPLEFCSVHPVVAPQGEGHGLPRRQHVQSGPLVPWAPAGGRGGGAAATGQFAQGGGPTGCGMATTPPGPRRPPIAEASGTESAAWASLGTDRPLRKAPRSQRLACLPLGGASGCKPVRLGTEAETLPALTIASQCPSRLQIPAHF